MSEYERSVLLYRFAELVYANSKDLADILTMENGKTLAEAQTEVEYAATFLIWFAEEVICSYVAELYTHPLVRKVSFTGSTTVGKSIAEKAAGTMKKISIELGGNALYIVFNDCDIDKATDGVLACKFRCLGLTCGCAKRLLVQRDVHDTFITALLRKMRGFKVGSGMDPTGTYGPLVNRAAVEKVRGHINDATYTGAKLIFGGTVRDDLGGYFIEPALLTGAT
ncbi:unnamed protein product [Parascedosporium putredinis]|uniref:Aldehyde dehydrogenase domain-containing protein n=1 Tax=Parascedosporium putredinis TaxID=1442378 RepID=A0A9P1HA84_9PEZI|nr:unnamed protein product [Parascedosporium putredinis]CAI8002551.1 unnamed protein product [Parascedosporium putredinis]